MTSGISVARQLMVGSLLRSVAYHEPERIAVKMGEKVYTYAQLEKTALQIAGWLQSKDVKQDSKVGFIFKNSLEFVEVFWGITLSGGVGVPINFRLASDEFIYVINDSDSEILFIEEDYIDVIETIRPQLPKVKEIVIVSERKVANTTNYKDIFTVNNTFNEVEQTDNDACMIMYTSGTTGKPKGAVMTHKNLVMNAQNLVRELQLQPYTRQIITAPLFHIAAMGSLLYCFLSKATVFIHRDFHPIAILECIEKEKINCIFLVPAMWNFVTSVPNIENYDLSSMEVCVAGAEICPVQLKEKVMKYFSNAKFYDVFGQTEMSPATLMLKPADSIRKAASVGKPILNVEVRIVDENMQDVPIGEIGEIVYRGPTLMKEYYKKTEETKEAFKGGWFHSGDLVSMDEEGFIYVRDRKKDMIISAGENIYPAEVEGVLYKHAGIFEVAVVGVPDEQWGESVKAYIVLKEGYTLTDQEVIDHCAPLLASYKKPKYVEFIDQLPRNASGKILKRLLKQ